jgi:uncharacterized protein YaaN involved in tellurite resistance
MIRKFIRWFISPNEKQITEDVYSKLIELQERIESLESESVENSNCFYELSNSIDAVDARIDILTLESWNKKDV